jgi:hypothetical protein
MDDSAVLRFALASGLIGFAVFGASYSLQVWRRRNAQVSPRVGGVAAKWQHRSLLLSIGGLLSMAAAIRELDRPEGRLLVEGLHDIYQNFLVTPALFVSVVDEVRGVAMRW